MEKLFSANYAFYGIMWKNREQPDRSCGNIIRRKRIACWINTATDTLKPTTYRLFIAKMVTRILPA